MCQFPVHKKENVVAHFGGLHLFECMEVFDTFHIYIDNALKAL